MQSGGSQRSIFDVVAWAVVAVIGALTMTQALGVAGSEKIAVAQSLTPYVGLLLVPLILLALWRGRLAMVTVAAATGFGLLVLATPLAFPDSQPAPIDDAVGLRVASLNLWYENTDIADVDEAVADLRPDVVVFNEYTSEHQAALRATSLAVALPHHIDLVGPGPNGIALWSRYPVEQRRRQDTFDDSLDVTVNGPDGEVRVVALHLTTPVVNFDAWRSDLHLVERIGRNASGPTLVIGDLNSTYWHPDFRRLLDVGFVDAHIAARKGFSTSWPMNWPIPPFVRLDHALTTGGLVSTHIEDFTGPGSDHRGLIVTVAPARPTTP